MALSERLLSGLSSERERWEEELSAATDAGQSVVGDALLGAACVAYAGAFPRPVRDHLIYERWLPDLELRGIAVTEDADPVRVLVDEGTVARWQSEGLPADQTSVENAAIVAACDRWPLLVDPQLQGIRWLRNSSIVRSLPSSSTATASGGGTGGGTGGGGGSDGATSGSAGGGDDHHHDAATDAGSAVGGGDDLGAGGAPIDGGGDGGDGTPPGSRPNSRHGTPDHDSGHAPMSRAPSSLAPQRGGRPSRHHQRRGHHAAVRRDLTIVPSTSPDLGPILERCVTLGLPVLVQLAGSTVPHVLAPILARRTYARGRTTYLRLAGREVEYNANFRLFLHSRAANPSFPPETTAQTTVVDFRVAPGGLEDQLLRSVVNVQRPRLEAARTELMVRMRGYGTKLVELEERLLGALARAEGDILGDASVVESLERTKEAAAGVHLSLEASRSARAKMERAREGYRAVATRGSLLYFLLEELSALHPVYRYSLASFVDVFLGTRLAAAAGDDPDAGARVVGASEAALLAEDGGGGGGGGNAGASSASTSAASAGGGAGGSAPHGGGVAAGKKHPETAGGASGNINNKGGKLDGGKAQDVTDGVGGGGGGDDTAEVSAAEVHDLVRSATLRVFRYVSTGLLEEHRLIFAFRLVLRVLDAEGELDAEGLEFLIRGATEAADENPCAEWLSMEAWNCVMALSSIRAFAELPSDMEKQPARFREWCDLERPETERLPLEWKNISSFGRLLVIRCLRPDRLGAAISNFVRDKLGREFSAAFTDGAGDLDAQIAESAGPAQPVLFLLTRGGGGGADPLARVEQLAAHLGLVSAGRWRHIAMGGGKEGQATAAVERAARDGGWVFLQNAELAPAWLARLEALLLRLAPSANSEMRVFLSVSIESGAQVALGDGGDGKGGDGKSGSDGGGGGEDYEPGLPDGLVRRALKITPSPPTGLKPNLHAAFASFPEDHIAASSKPTELRAVLFALSFLHSVFAERKRYGPAGWSVGYGFGAGDLADAGDVVSVYVDSRRGVPWRDIQHIVSEVIYGGHVTDEWDRRLLRTFVETTLNEDVLDGAELAPDLAVPTALPHDRYHAYIDANLTVEGPAMVSLNANAEMAHRLRTSTQLLTAITRMRPSAGRGGGYVLPPDFFFFFFFFFCCFFFY
jgi:dynein heavy chain